MTEERKRTGPCPECGDDLLGFEREEDGWKIRYWPHNAGPEYCLKRQLAALRTTLFHARQAVLTEGMARDRAEATVERLLDVADAEAWRCAFEYRRAAEDGYARDRLNDYWDDARCAVGLAQRLRAAAQPQPTAAKAGP